MILTDQMNHNSSGVTPSLAQNTVISTFAITTFIEFYNVFQADQWLFLVRIYCILKVSNWFHFIFEARRHGFAWSKIHRDWNSNKKDLVKKDERKGLKTHIYFFEPRMPEIARHPLWEFSFSADAFAQKCGSEGIVRPANWRRRTSDSCTETYSSHCGHLAKKHDLRYHPTNVWSCPIDVALHPTPPKFLWNRQFLLVLIHFAPFTLAKFVGQGKLFLTTWIDVIFLYKFFFYF